MIPGGGESQAMKQERVHAAIGEIMRNHLGSSVVVVSHGGALRDVASKAAQDSGLDAGHGFSTPNCSVSRVRGRDREGKWELVSWGESGHLETAALGEGGLDAYEGGAR